MKAIFLLLILPISTVFGQAKKPVSKALKPAQETGKTVASLTSLDSLSYAIGVQVAAFYKHQGVEKINSDLVKKAYDDIYNDKNLTITLDQANTLIQQKVQEFMTKKISAEKEKSEKFLAANKTKPGVVTLPSGLQYEIITKGAGPIPKSTDKVKANYVGTLIDGEEFDNSYKRGEPLEIPITGVIKGWTEALELMPVGSKWKLFIPSDLAYGDRGAGQIPGGAALIFEIELLEIVN